MAALSFITHGAAAPLVGAGSHSSIVVRDDNFLWSAGPYGSHAPPSALKLGTAWSVIDCVDDRTVGIDSNGALWTWGSAIGLERPYSSVYPVQVGTDSHWRSVSADDRYTLAVKEDGTLWGWGNFYVGYVPIFDSWVPVQVGSASNWSFVTGSGYNLGIRKDGSLWALGHNGHGNLGDGTNVSRTEPVRVGNATNWKSAACVDWTSFGIKEDGSLWVWGGNGGTYGNGGTGGSSMVPVRVGTDNNWRKISGKNSAVLALRTDGSLWSWGVNSGGMLGLGATTAQYSPARIGTDKNWADVSAGDGHVIAARTDGSIWAWGNNAIGQFGITGVSSSNVPLDVSTAFVAVPRFVIYDDYGPVVNYPQQYWSVKTAIEHEPTDLEIRIRNDGFIPLDLSASRAQGFTATFPPTVAGLSDATIKVRMDAGTAGNFVGQLVLNSNDSARPMFTVNLDGRVVSAADDTDNDGMNDAAEVALAPLGFVWNSTETTKVAQFFENAGLAGLFQASEIQAVEWKAGAPFINLPAQTIRIPLELKSSADISAPLITPENLLESAGGGLEISVPLQPGKRFIWLKKP
ncbi:hypothetical protein GCM10023212_23660 [Luteolibacter yonseiensis]